VIIWGCTWIAITLQLGDVAPSVSIVYRFGFAAFILFIYCRMKKLPLTFNGRQHLQLFLFGITLFGINYYLIYQAQQYINSALSCIACSLLLFFNIINARIWYKTHINYQVYLGGLLGIIGISTLFWPQISNINLGTGTLLGVTFCLIGSLFASAGNMLSIRNNKLKLPLLPANAWGMFYGTCMMTVIALIQGDTFTFSYTFSYISSLLYLSIFGSVIAFACYLTLLNNIGAHKASYAAIMFPAIAVIISTFAEDFSWSVYTVVGLSLILLGNLIVLAKPIRSGKKEDKLALKLAENN